MTAQVSLGARESGHRQHPPAMARCRMAMTRASRALLAILLVRTGPALGRDDPHAACAVPPSYVPAELLERPIALRAGIGNSHEAVTTKSDARNDLDAARRELETVPQATLGIDPPRSIVALWVEALRGELLLRTGQRDEGHAVLKDVVRALRAALGPDAWSQALFRLESMARSAIEAGDWDLAEFIAAQMLDHDAVYGGSHSTIALVLRHKGDDAGVAREVEAARGYWRDADPDLLDLKQITTEGDAKR